MVKLVTLHENASVAKAMEMSVRADNEDAPEPLKIRSKARGRRLTSEISGAQDVESLLLTTDDLLLCIIAAERTLSLFRLKSARLHRRARISSSPAPKV